MWKSPSGSSIFTMVDGGWGGLCSAFQIVASSSGTLAITLRWTADAPLSVFFKSAVGAQIDMTCCNAPAQLRVPVEAGTPYRMEVADSGRPPGTRAFHQSISHSRRRWRPMGRLSDQPRGDPR